MDSLSIQLKELLLKAHTKHLATMGPEEREKHALDNIVKVSIDKKLRCLKVYYKHEWYHYTPAGTWY